MSGGKLPSLRRREVAHFFRHFAGDEWAVQGTNVTGHRGDQSFTVHLEHDRTLTQQQLNRALGYMGVSRDEFWEWYGSR